VNREEFDRGVAEVEQQAKKSPRLYRLRVIGFASLGWVVYVAALLGVVGILVGMVALILFMPNIATLSAAWKFGVPLLVLLGALLKALVVKTRPPTGLTLNAGQAPRLFEALDSLRARLKVPPFEKVLLTDEYNAGVMQLPRFGLLGSRNFLKLGLPLMQAISVDDFQSVLAHELGHLSRNHGRIGGWIYRSVQSYVRLLHEVRSNRMLLRFLNWYVPQLDILSFPLRRNQEYQADASAAEVTSPERTAQALVNVEVRSQQLRPFWEAVSKSVLHSANPPVQLFASWGNNLRQAVDPEDRTALERAMQVKTNSVDTHPSLKDRVAALGAEVTVESLPATNAAQVLLGERYEYFVEQVGYLWSSRVNEEWKARYAKIEMGRKELAALEQLLTQRKLDVEEAYKRACLSEELHPELDALPLYQEVKAINEWHVGGRFACGRLLLERGDAAGLAMVEPMTRHDRLDMRFAAAAVLFAFHSKQGDKKAAAKAEKQLRRLREKLSHP
jgi:Zn-dependent protease with chaperone function